MKGFDSRIRTIVAHFAIAGCYKGNIEIIDLPYLTPFFSLSRIRFVSYICKKTADSFPHHLKRLMMSGNQRIQADP